MLRGGKGIIVPKVQAFNPKVASGLPHIEEAETGTDLDQSVVGVISGVQANIQRLGWFIVKETVGHQLAQSVDGNGRPGFRIDLRAGVPIRDIDKIKDAAGKRIGGNILVRPANLLQ